MPPTVPEATASSSRLIIALRRTKQTSVLLYVPLSVSDDTGATVEIPVAIALSLAEANPGRYTFEGSNRRVARMIRVAQGSQYQRQPHRPITPLRDLSTAFGPWPGWCERQRSAESVVTGGGVA